MLSNYQIKKMIPRLIVAAILVNTSYWIGALAVDLSNLLGYNLAKLFANIDIGASGASQFSESWGNVLAVVLVAPAATAALIVAIVAAPASLLAFAFMILILMVRKALIVLLIVVAPVAFVAYLLPNTEDWFKRWYKVFVAVLILFPVTSMVFGASKLASDILLQVAQREYAGDDVQNMLFIIALGVAAVPLFAVPTLLFAALKSIGAIGSRLQGMGNNASRSASAQGKRKAMDSRVGELRTAFNANRQEARVRRRRGDGFIARRVGDKDGNAFQRTAYRAGTVSRSIDDKLEEKGVAKYVGSDRGAAAAVATYHKAANEEVDRQQSLYSETMVEDLIEKMESGEGSAEHRAAIIRQITKAGGDQHVQAAYDYLSRHADDKGMNDVQQLASDALLSRKPAGVSTTAANALKTGTMGKKDGPNAGFGYKKMLMDRVQKRAFGASDYARMGKDDLIRLAELAQEKDEKGNYRLNAADIDHIRTEANRILTDETLKGSMTGERLAFFESTLMRSGPHNATGAKQTLQPLAYK